MVLDRDGGDETIGCGRGNSVFSKTTGKLPGCIPPIRVELKQGYRRKPLEEAGGSFGFGQACQQFKQYPLSDGCLRVDDQRLESSLDLGMPRRTKRVDPNGGINQIHEGSVYDDESEASQV